MRLTRRTMLLALAGTVTAKARAPATKRLTPAPQFSAPGCSEPCTSWGKTTKKH